jgi:hypothetical protein
LFRVSFRRAIGSRVFSLSPLPPRFSLSEEEKTREKGKRERG